MCQPSNVALEQTVFRALMEWLAQYPALERHMGIGK